MDRSSSHHGFYPNIRENSPTYVRVPLALIRGVDGGGHSGRNPEVTAEVLMNRWAVFLKNHIPHIVFDAMMQDIFDGPYANQFMSKYYYATAGSWFASWVILFSICLPCALAVVLFQTNRMKSVQVKMEEEVRRKCAQWNRVFEKYNCGVSMDVNEFGVNFSINPEETLKSEDMSDDMIRDMGIRKVHRV